MFVACKKVMLFPCQASPHPCQASPPSYGLSQQLCISAIDKMVCKNYDQPITDLHRKDNS